MRVGLHNRFHPDERLDVRSESVGHQVKLSVGRDKRDRPIVLESRESHAPSQADDTEPQEMERAGEFRRYGCAMP